MTYLDERAAPCAPSRRGGLLRDLDVVAVAVVTAVTAWAFSTAAGDGEIAVRTGAGVRTIGLLSVAATAAVVAAVGAAVLRVMVARVRNGLRRWTVLACGVLLVSVLGPLGATNLADGMTLLSLHSVVGAVVILGLRRAYRGC